MFEKPDTSPPAGIETPSRIEIRLSPDRTRERLLANLQRAYQRAGVLLAELTEATDRREPDLAQIRELAAGVRFEVEFAKALTRPLAGGDAANGITPQAEQRNTGYP